MTDPSFSLHSLFFLLGRLFVICINWRDQESNTGVCVCIYIYIKRIANKKMNCMFALEYMPLPFVYDWIHDLVTRFSGPIWVAKGAATLWWKGISHRKKALDFYSVESGCCCCCSKEISGGYLDIPQHICFKLVIITTCVFA